MEVAIFFINKVISFIFLTSASFVSFVGIGEVFEPFFGKILAWYIYI